MVAAIVGNPYQEYTKKYTHKLLSLSIIGLGAGMNLEVIAKVGAQGIWYTVIGITVTFLIGLTLGKFLKNDKDTSLLITVGTAICGGSAIAAVAPVIRAKSEQVSIALGTVFMLNAVALFIFPWVGHALALDQHQFGLWSALAIHDTSSVVGATLTYGPQALEVGTTVKLARALWIVPVALCVGLVRSRKNETGEKGKIKKPWFILGFLIAAAIVTWVPEAKPLGFLVETIARKLMLLTLFLIGANLTMDTLKSVGIKPFIQGIFLWLVMATSTLLAVYFDIIS